ncbi:MAG: DMT family transporter [Leptospiraceae bacterium]|nr:DMT family transporter [Leptospiraceae bacterium]
MTEDQDKGQLIFVSRALRADLMLLLCALFWGGTFVAIELAVKQMPPYLLVALRFLGAAAVFLPFYIVLKVLESRQSRTGGAGSRSWWKGMLAGLFLGLISFAGYGLQTQGLVYTTPARSAFITQLLVLFTFPMQIFFLRRKVIASAYAGLTLVLLGAYFLLGSPAGGAWNTGDWLTIGCAFSFALLIVMLDVLARRFSVADLTFYQILGTGLMAALASRLGLDNAYLSASPNTASLLSEGNGGDFLQSLMQMHWQSQLLLSLLYLAIPATIGTVLIQVRFQKETSPARASLLYAMEPVFAGIFAFLILGQFLGWAESLGALLIVLGVIVSEAFSTKKQNDQKAANQFKSAQKR